jgi:serine protease inhibitor
VSQSTKGVIKRADIEVDSNTKMILASTIYFKGQWLFAFDKTQDSDFHLLNGETVKVKSMNARRKYYSGRFSNLDARWAAIPYNSTEALIIILPNENSNIDDVIKNMNGLEFKEIIDDITGYPASNFANITLPKFKINSKIDLKGPLQKMGIKKIFEEDSNLFLFEDGVPSRVGAATQQSSLEIDEKGSIGK